LRKPNDDPSDLIYSTYLGGSPHWDQVNAIAVDSAGRATVTGITMSDVFPTTPGALDPTFGGGTCGVPPYTSLCKDAFVARLSADGSTLEYSTYRGGSDDDSASDVAVDSSGRITVAGSTASNNFPTTPGAYDRTFAGGMCGTAPYLTPCADIFIARLDAAGNALVFSTFLGGNDDDDVNAIALDSAGQTTLTGSAASQGFPTTPGAYDTTFNGGQRCYNSTGDTYVTRLDADGGALAFSSFLGGSHGDEAFDMAVDSTGRATVVGRTCSVDFPTTPDAFDTSLRYLDGFVTRFTVDGQSLDYSTFLGGDGSSDHAYGVALDSQGRAIAAGFTASDGFPTTPGAYDPDYTPGLAGFIAKLDMDPYSPNVLAPIEQPSAGAVVSGTVILSGYAIDRRSPAGAGIDLVHIYLDGPYGTGTIIGGATYGLDRPDIAAQYGARFRPSGWELAWGTGSLAPGVHRLYLYAHR
jgi:hypothetical protein